MIDIEAQIDLDSAYVPLNIVYNKFVSKGFI